MSLLSAFGGLTYEFTLAQSLSLTLGNSATQYALTIGLFLGGMGLGAWRAERRGEEGDARELYARLQLALAAAVPPGFVGLWALSMVIGRGPLAALAYGLVLAIGALTGAELPLLMRLVPAAGRGRVLAADYAGMLLACVAFPLCLLPSWGVFRTLFATALVNALALALVPGARRPRARRTAAALLGLVLLWLMWREETLREWLSRRLVEGAA